MIIKVCGMRDAENMQAVARLGIQLMGFIFYAKSPRFVGSVPQRSVAEANVKRIGVFVNADESYIQQCLQSNDLDGVQLHGNESPDFCRQLKASGCPLVIKALSIASAADLSLAEQYQDAADLLLFDTKCTGHGGSGQQFDWHILDGYHGALPFLLSGGIGLHNSEQLLRFQHPRWRGIDLNSCFETEPGHKDVARLQRFIDSIKSIC